MKCFRWILALGLFVGAAQAATLPQVRLQNGASQLMLDGRPFLIFGGELSNSAAGTADQADRILPRLAALHVNTVLVPVAWDQLEPRENHYDYRLLDHWLAVARQQHLHLVLLWFGSWKNGFSEYAPAWVKADVARFPRAQAANGEPLEILSTFGRETMHRDSMAFAALMAHLRATDAVHTVVLVQVENEVGLPGDRRDRSPTANQAFNAAVPPAVLRALSGNPSSMSGVRDPGGRDWGEVFGDGADEAFMAWRYASYIDAVAAAGKAQYDLPMYLNTQLPAPLERAGQYPSGAPHPGMQPIYRATALHVDFYAPDIYWPEFAQWVRRYQSLGNPVFVPEARLDVAPYNALYLFGEAKGFGFSPFDIDSLVDAGPKPLLMQVYAALQSFGAQLPEAQMQGRTRGLVLHADSPRPTRIVALGGYLFEAALSRTWPARTLATQHGAALILQDRANEFYIVGTGLDIAVRRDPDVDAGIAGIDSIEEVAQQGGQWQVLRRLNGDESDQGRQLLMDPHDVHIYRLRLHVIAR